MTDLIRITADEINCLIYSYFVDSGFNHSAFSICHEGQLERSPHFSKHIPRGELIELLSKALLYVEVESHWRGDDVVTECKSGFSLLERHVCSPDAPNTMPPPAPTSILEGGLVGAPRGINMTIPEAGAKRKTSPVMTDGPVEKRSKRDQDDMDIDTGFDSIRSRQVNESISRTITPEPNAVRRPKPRPQGPVDDLTDPNAIITLSGHQSEVFVCSFNPTQPTILASGAKDANMKFWMLPDEAAGLSVPTEPPKNFAFGKQAGQGDVTSLNWNHDGTLLAVGTYDSVLRVYSASGELYFEHPQHEKGPVFSTRFSPSGRWLLSASLDGTACLWDIRSKQLHRQYRCHSDCCLDVDWLNDVIFVTCGTDTHIQILSVDEVEPLKTLSGHAKEINQIKCSPSGTRIISGSDDTTARVWNVESVTGSSEVIPGLVASDHVVVLAGHRNSVTTVLWYPHRSQGGVELVATSSFDGTARLWDAVTGSCLHVFADHKRSVYALQFSPSGRYVATGSGDGWFNVYEVSTKEKIWSWSASLARSFATNSRPQGTVLGQAVKNQRSNNAFWSSHGPFSKFQWRSYMQERPIIREAQQVSWQRLALTAGGVAAAVTVIQGALNRETRDALSEAERSYLNESFAYTGAGLALTAVAARTMFRNGFAFRVMSANPWVVLGVSLVGSIGSMMGVLYTPPEKSIQKHIFWLAFNACQAATLSPLYFLNPALLSRAALYTCGVVGSLSYVGATAANDKYLTLGGPLLAGVTVVALSSLAPLALPLGMRGLAVTEAISLYGGLAVFGGFVLYDTQKILKNARLAEQGVLKRDPMRESVSLELDMINIFIRLVQILSMHQRNRR
ncbi:hypothetical protein AX16_000436 [Volvariella volvacea WC 439]|nr:hypothetical protein AX16_000436 [Volvariella volvacea WC 439]